MSLSLDRESKSKRIKHTRYCFGYIVLLWRGFLPLVVSCLTHILFSCASADKALTSVAGCGFSVILLTSFTEHSMHRMSI